MPYQRSLHQYLLPEFFAEVPESWERRLREVSPIRSDLDHLVFRKFEPVNPDGSDRGWLNPERPQWTLYRAKPIRLVAEHRAKQFEKHWSELHEVEREGRRALVSDYQHFMWHGRGLYVEPFLILQGEWGGTPAKYTEQEIAFLQGSECFDEAYEIGFFPACQFDERVVKTIALRDRMLNCANDLAALSAMDSPESQKGETEAAALVKRETILDTWKIMIQPSADYMSHWMQRSEHRDQLPPAPKEVEDNVGHWREHFLEHGAIPGARIANQRQIR